MRLEKDLKHAQELADKAGDMIEKKYLIGAKKHGGNIKRKLMVPHALEEATDLMVYLLTLQEQWQEMINLIEDTHWLDHDALKITIRKVHSILTRGNPEGIEEEELEK